MTRSRADVERILRERAEALAEPVASAAPKARVELLVLSFGAERYAIETVHVIEVMALRDLTPVPCTPAFVLGVLNYRGRLLTVLDVRRFFDLPGTGQPPGSRIVAVEAGGITFGLFAEGVAGPVTVGADEMALPPVGARPDRRVLVRGVTEEMAAVLDLEGFARDPRITVSEEVG